MARRNLHDVAIHLHGSDDLVVLKKPVKTGDELVNGSVCLHIRQDIRAGHKVAIRDLKAGETLKKYGQIIGMAQAPIAAGDHVHTHNVNLKQNGRDYEFGTAVVPVTLYPPERMRYFQGYARPGGRVGTRKYVAVISSVNCSASVSHYIRDRFRTEQFKRDFPKVDGVVAFTHKGGCAMDPGEPKQLLQRVLAGMARHPNISGYVMIGLGCETNQIDAIRASYRLDRVAAEENA